MAWLVCKHRPDGSFKFADHPHQHASEAEANVEATRLSRENEGVKFSVFRETSIMLAQPSPPPPELDRHGRRIIARNDGAMVVECCDNEDDKERFQICSSCTNFWFGEDGDGWIKQATTDRYWGTGIHTKEWCMTNLPLAARTPLPKVESEKGPFWAVQVTNGKMAAYATKKQRDWLVGQGNYWEPCNEFGEVVE